jgi:tellurite resistance-related uncharacterized protein
LEDEAGDPIAQLDCGHARHVRHEPPLSERPWVLDPAERNARIGSLLDCARCQSRELPEGFVEYKRTTTFTEQTLPSGLRSRHTTRPGIWALIHVERGRLRYRIHEPFHEEQILAPGIVGVVLPAVPHEVDPLGHVRVAVAFHRHRAC